MATVTYLVWTSLVLTLAAVTSGYMPGHSEERDLMRLRMYHFQYKPKITSRKFTINKDRTTTKRKHFFDTTRTDVLEWFREMPVCIDNGKGSFYRRRLTELAENNTDFVDKSYILKELGDRLAPAGRIHSKSLYLSGYRFLSDERNIDMIVKFFDIEVDNEGNELPVHQKVNKKLFAGGHVLVNNTLKILKPLFVSETYLWDYQGNIPCVVLNFNKITGNSYEAIRQDIAGEIRKIFAKYSYLFQPPLLSKRAQNSYDIYSNGDVTHDELYNAILFVMRSIYKKYRTQILFILNDGEDSIIVNYKTSVQYLISDSFANLKLQLLHKYANIVRRNLKLNDTPVAQDDYDGEGDRLALGDGEWKEKKSYVTPKYILDRRIINRKILKPSRMDKKLMQQRARRTEKSPYDFNHDVAGKDLFGGILRGHGY